LDPATGDVVQIPLGEGSPPHGIIVGQDGAAWETKGALNSIVSFDPASERFESHPSSRPGADVRQMLGRPGEARGMESGTDRLVVVDMDPHG